MPQRFPHPIRTLFCPQSPCPQHFEIQRKTNEYFPGHTFHKDANAVVEKCFDAAMEKLRHREKIFDRDGKECSVSPLRNRLRACIQKFRKLLLRLLGRCAYYFEMFVKFHNVSLHDLYYYNGWFPQTSNTGSLRPFTSMSTRH